ncbi:MAG: transglutaminase family protein [Clostridia bacterium]|nr:transglutaminase family protein [Clostridia bacterium]
MALLNYEYRMNILYSEPVNKCCFTIKAVPGDDFRQKNIHSDIKISPVSGYTEGKDSFGNIQITGKTEQPHTEFDFLIKGLAETNSIGFTEKVNPGKVGMYKYPHGKCVPGKEILRFAGELRNKVEACAGDKEKCLLIMNHIYERMVYEAGSTHAGTDAEEAFHKGRGVCQDYAHIYITLLRIFGIPARYVCGLLAGEGESHAWVEAACEGFFVGFDPTHNCEITEEYIRFGTGRDAYDCAINRGIMWGGGIQIQKVTSRVYCLE